jgi:hypothetical protein
MQIDARHREIPYAPPQCELSPMRFNSVNRFIDMGHFAAVIGFLLPVGLQEDAVDVFDVDGFVGSADGFDHAADAEVASLAQDAVDGADDEIDGGLREGMVAEADAVEFAKNEVAHGVGVQPLGDDRVSDAALDVVVDAEVEGGEQAGPADEDEVVVLGAAVVEAIVRILTEEVENERFRQDSIHASGSTGDCLHSAVRSQTSPEESRERLQTVLYLARVAFSGVNCRIGVRTGEFGYSVILATAAVFILPRTSREDR